MSVARWIVNVDKKMTSLKSLVKTLTQTSNDQKKSNYEKHLNTIPRRKVAVKRDVL